MKTLTVITAVTLVLVPYPLGAGEGLAPDQGTTIQDWKDAEGGIHFSDTGADFSSETYAVAGTVSTRSPDSPPPPVAQDLVRQGYFAMNLVKALQLLRTPEDEAEAEEMLASVGIAPDYGWIGDYPVTPDIAEQLRSSVAEAADLRRIDLARAGALAAFDELCESFGLPVGEDLGPPSETPASEIPEDAYVERHVVERYYYDYGPPVITYYPPPYRYLGLYAWVPYPFWWHDFYFSGYYILTDFHIVISLTHRHPVRHFPVIHHGHGDWYNYKRDRMVLITNRAFRKTHREWKRSVREYPLEDRHRYNRPGSYPSGKHSGTGFEDSRRHETRDPKEVDRHVGRKEFSNPSVKRRTLRPNHGSRVESGRIQEGFSAGRQHTRVLEQASAEKSRETERHSRGHFKNSYRSGDRSFSRRDSDGLGSRSGRPWSDGSYGRHQRGR